MDMILDKVKDGAGWVAGKTADGIVWTLKEGCILILKGCAQVAIKLSDYYPYLIITMCAGMIIVICGKKELGTKITSCSILLYALIRAVKG